MVAVSGGASTEPEGGGSARTHSASELLNTMIFVTSDNVQAAKQMSSVVGHPYSLLTPQVFPTHPLRVDDSKKF